MSTPATALVSPEVHADGRVTLRLQRPEAYRETEGAHVWSAWRRNLCDTLPLLFR
jgi:hypothetical protein